MIKNKVIKSWSSVSRIWWNSGLSILGSGHWGWQWSTLRPRLLHIRATLCSARLLWCPFFVFQTAVKFCKTSHIFTGEIIKLIFRVWYFTAWLVNNKRPDPKSRNTEGLMVSPNAENQRLYLNLLEYHRTRLIQLSPLLEKENKYYESIYKKDCHLR